MAVTFRSPEHSFVQFGEDEEMRTCYPGDVGYCLPVMMEDDIAFQLLLDAATASELNDICNTIEDDLIFGVVLEEGDAGFTIDFNSLGFKPETVRVSPTQLLILWPHGIPALDGLAFEQCFRIRMTHEDSNTTLHSNCFQRIRETECFTSVIQYGSTLDEYGFVYCNTPDSEVVTGGGGSTGNINYTDDYDSNYS